MNSADDILKSIVENAVHIGGTDYRLSEKYLEAARHYVEGPEVFKTITVYCDRFLKGNEKSVLPPFIEITVQDHMIKYKFKPLSTAKTVELFELLPTNAVLFVRIGNDIAQLEPKRDVTKELISAKSVIEWTPVGQ